uniref:Nucleolar protein 16 n=1 Tax=Culicoides sonorensis TaxID=179676 RepID=A0A336KAS8_CULSO
MVKQLRRTRMAKKYNYQRNRKRVEKKIKNKGTIKDSLIKQEWQKGMSLSKNLDDLGLVFDSNKALGVPNNREERKKIIKIVNGFMEEDTSDLDVKKEEFSDEEEIEIKKKSSRSKEYVAEKLEQEANEYVESRFKLPKGVVKQVSYYMDKYGLNYKAMARDPQNYYQETWRQLRAKCRKFMSISDQFAKYLEERGLMDKEIDEGDPRWKEAETDDD